MNYYQITYPQYNTLVIKSALPINEVLHALSVYQGITSHGGAIYNPKSFLTLSEISSPNTQQLHVAMPLEKALI